MGCAPHGRFSSDLTPDIDVGAYVQAVADQFSPGPEAEEAIVSTKQQLFVYIH